MSSASKVFENLTRNQYVGVGLAGAVVVVGAYFLIKKILADVKDGVTNLGTKAYHAVTGTADQAGELLSASPDPNGSTFVSWYDPTQRSVFFYWLAFPDGSHHFLGAGSVQSNGTFDYDGTTYRIGLDKIGDLRAYLWGDGWG